MKILWVKSDLLHPTTKGGHIRTLEMLRRLHQRHEVHYVAFENDPTGEGLRRSGEYCTKVYPVAHAAPNRTSPAFRGPTCARIGFCFARGNFSLPIGRYVTAAQTFD